jgi:hypothetical protein
MGAGRLKIELDAFAQLGGVDPDNIVGAAIVGDGTSEDFGANLLLVNLGPAILERLSSDIEEEVAQAGGAAEVGAGGDALDQRLPLLNAREFLRCFQGRIFCNRFDGESPRNCFHVVVRHSSACLLHPAMSDEKTLKFGFGRALTGLPGVRRRTPYLVLMKDVTELLTVKT